MALMLVATVCDAVMPLGVICDQENQISSIRLAYCVFYDSVKDDINAAMCMSLYPKSVIEKNSIPLPKNLSQFNTFVCGKLNREVKEPLCGRCAGDTGPSIYSVGNQCVPCTPVNIIYYVLLQYLPTTMLFLVVLLFRVNVTSPPMAHYVLFYNLSVVYCKFDLSFYTTLYSTSNSYILTLVKCVVTLNAVLSFDALFFFSPPLCITRHIEEIYKPFIEFVATLYPFVLLLLTYIVVDLHTRNVIPFAKLWRPLYCIYTRCFLTWEPRASIVQAFNSTF